LVAFVERTPYLVAGKKLKGKISPQPNRMAAQSEAWVYGSSLAGIVSLNPAGRMDVCLLRVLGVVR
jgi:hypothetical protein